jgi:hypothetical protein
MGEQAESMSGACYKCKYRGTVYYSCHSSCHHPDKTELEVKGDAYGRRSGWFSFPVDFDPVWLESCNGFENKEPATEEPTETADEPTE